MKMGRSDDGTREPAAASGGTEWVARVHGGRLKRRERRALSEWLAASEENARDYLRAETVWRVSGGLQSDPRVQEALNAIRSSHGAARRTLRPMAGKRAGWRLGSASAAAAVVVAAVAAWFFLKPTHVWYETALGEQRVVRLRDGSTIALNTDTRLWVQYGDAERSVLLERGEALFQVNKDPRRAFIVRAGDGYARAIGTRFDVLEGRVEVAAQTAAARISIATEARAMESASNDSLTFGPDGERVLLDAGQSASYEKGGQQVKVADPQRASRERIVAWREGKLRFDAWPLARALEEHNRYAVKPIRFDDRALDKVRISGVFRIGDTAALLDALGQLIDVEVREDNDALVLVRPEASVH